MSSKPSPHHGLLIVDKPGLPSTYQPTSHDVVAAVRRCSGQRRIGHTGTLDPMASGVLVLCLGKATRLVEYYKGHDKQYVADIRLGSATDTYDATGMVSTTSPVPDMDTDSLQQILDRFRGDIMQTPPAYSAIKQDGEALHRKARRGEAIQIAARKITVHNLELLERKDCVIRLRVKCAAGTYIRSLAHDIGIAMGTSAHLASLRREAAGPFNLRQAHSLEYICEVAGADKLDSLLLAMGTGLDMPKLYPDPESITRLGQGQQVILPRPDSPPDAATEAVIKEDQLAQIIALDGSLAGIVRSLGPSELQQNRFVWRAAKWLLDS